ncbi:MAG: hypothetical protein ACOYBQ_06485 [Fluviibacter sp.]
MLSLSNTSLVPKPRVFALEEMTHLATSSLNSLEYMTAVSLGIAHESCANAARKSDSILNATSLLEVTAFLSIAPVNLLEELSQSCIQIHEAAKNYYEYVSLDYSELH